jgi:hypothetical protein
MIYFLDGDNNPGEPFAASADEVDQFETGRFSILCRIE